MGISCLIYLYSKLSEGCMWKTKHVTDIISLLKVIFIGLLMFICHFHNTFATSLLVIHVFQHFTGLDPPTLPMHLRLVMGTNIY